MSIMPARKVKAPKPNPLFQLLKEVGKESNLVRKLKEIDILEVLYTDFTEIIYGKGKLKAQLMPCRSRSGSWCQHRFCSQSLGKSQKVLKLSGKAIGRCDYSSR